MTPHETLRRRRPIVVFYDGDCGFCHAAVKFLLKRDRAGVFAYAPLHGETFNNGMAPAVREDLPDSLVILRPNGTVYTLSTGVLYAATRLGGLYAIAGWAGLMIPGPVRDVAYRLVARVRRRLFAAPATSCPIVPAELRGRFLP